MEVSRTEPERAPIEERRGAVLGLTRAGIGVLLVLAIANGVFLYFFPSRAEPDYAWAIKPPVSAAAMGAGYLAGMVAAILGIFVAKRFSSVRLLVPGFCALGVLLLAATLIHSDKFRWDYAPTWGWTAVYAGLPVAAVYLWVRQTRVAGAEPEGEGDAQLRRIQLLGAALGAILTGFAAALFIAPDSLLDEWPWPITPLISRVLAGWYALAGLILLCTAYLGRGFTEGVIPYATVGAWSVLLLPLPALYEESMRTDASLYLPWILLHVAVVAACGWAIIRASALMSARGETL